MDSPKTVQPVVLAAGHSRRMGYPKPFARIGGKSFLNTILDRLAEANLPHPIVVANPDHRALYARTAHSGIHFVWNPCPDDGMLSSFRLGLAALPRGMTHALFCLADMPLIETATYRLIARKATESPGQIVLATCEGKDAHPVAFPREVFSEFERDDLTAGARTVIERNAKEIVRIETGDRMTLLDIDTPHDLHIEENNPERPSL